MQLKPFYEKQYRKLVSQLAGQIGCPIEVAEDAIQEAVLAFQVQSPDLEDETQDLVKWIYKVGYRKALDQTKHWSQRRLSITWYDSLAVEEEKPPFLGNEPSETQEAVNDDMPWQDAELRSLYLFAQPGLSTSSQVALILRSTAGWSVGQLAAYYLCSYDTIEKRLSRARNQLKTKTKDQLFRVSLDESRLAAVLQALYLLFSEGYFSPHGNRVIDMEGMSEAYRLCALLSSHPKTQGRPEVWALLALMTYHIARLPSRMGQGEEAEKGGTFISLALQDRSLWDQTLIKQAGQYLNWSAQGDQMSRYHLEAAIAAIHTETQRFEDTDWSLILTYYQQLERLAPSTATRLNLLIAQGYAVGWETINGLIQSLSGQGLDGYVQLVVGMMYEKLGQPTEAIGCYEEARDFFGAEGVKSYIKEKIESLSS